MKDNALYLEVDEDITSAIDKLTKTPGTSVQIVVPKRSTMLQSIINLKLLKKAAEAGGKSLVLVTNDRVAGDLASRVGLATAPSLGAKPVIREAELPAELQSGDEIIEADDPEPPSKPQEPELKASAKRLLLRRKDVSGGPPALPDPTPAATPDATQGSAVMPGGAVASSPKGPKIPNFKRLQRRVLWLGLAVLLFGGYMLGMYLFSSANVTLYANGTKVDIDTSFAVDPNLKETDAAKATLAGQLITVSKDLSGPFTPTGKKDVGTKASGQITVSNATGTDQVLVTGTRFAAPDGKVFRSGADITVPKAYLNGDGDKVNGTMTVTVTADQAGDSYNEAAAAYTIPALSNPKITAQGAQMSGGVTKTVTVVTQSDVDGARSDLVSKDKDNAARDLKGRLPSGYVALDASQATTVTTTTPAPAIDAEGSTGSLSLKVTYTVLAVKQSEYDSLVESQELKQIGDTNQIYQNGIDSAQVTAGERDSAGRQSFHLTTEAYGGAKLDKTAIVKSLIGKRLGDANDLAGRLPGVSKAEITLSPVWSTTLPKRPAKIHITIQVAASK